jgi:O-methyltransferase involved in polyketide biosynthesis
MRLFIAARCRFSEETLAARVARGARQVVVLGAGLDTFSLATRLPPTVFACSKVAMSLCFRGSTLNS